MNNNTVAPINSLTSQSKDTDIQALLNTIPHLKTLSNSLILKLADRFSANPDLPALLIKAAIEKGGLYGN